jgi:hypothetical protein
MSKSELIMIVMTGIVVYGLIIAVAIHYYKRKEEKLNGTKN